MKDDHLIVAIYKLLQLRKHIQRPAPSWLGRLVERCTSIVEVKGWNPVQGWIFSGFLFATAKVAYINCDDHPSFKNLIPFTVNKRPASSLFQQEPIKWFDGLLVPGIQVEECGRKITILVDGPLFFWRGEGVGVEKFSHANVMAPELTHQTRPLGSAWFLACGFRADSRAWL